MAVLKTAERLVVHPKLRHWPVIAPNLPSCHPSLLHGRSMKSNNFLDQLFRSVRARTGRSAAVLPRRRVGARNVTTTGIP